MSASLFWLILAAWMYVQTVIQETLRFFHADIARKHLLCKEHKTITGYVYMHCKPRIQFFLPGDLRNLVLVMRV